ncbi:hypothetical protein, partial [Oceanispirochaeta sp.]|uniref:hypothetical protein n=1 Tax=Oceanispirochaeta sp. TaxID=2035350 RepID=UPI00262164DA
MIRSISVFLSLFLLVFQGCSFDFLNTEESPVNSSSYTKYDSEGDIKYCYDSEDELLWYEYYDFNDQNQCIFLKHCLPSGAVVWSYVYSWTGSNLTGEAYFGSSNTLSWFNNYNYSG